jgi:hypothetical protein
MIREPFVQHLPERLLDHEMGDELWQRGRCRRSSGVR